MNSMKWPENNGMRTSSLGKEQRKGRDRLKWMLIAMSSLKLRNQGKMFIVLLPTWTEEAVQETRSQVTTHQKSIVYPNMSLHRKNCKMQCLIPILERRLLNLRDQDRNLRMLALPVPHQMSKNKGRSQNKKV